MLTSERLSYRSVQAAPAARHNGRQHIRRHSDEHPAATAGHTSDAAPSAYPPVFALTPTSRLSWLVLAGIVLCSAVTILVLSGAFSVKAPSSTPRDDRLAPRHDVRAALTPELRGIKPASHSQPGIIVHRTPLDATSTAASAKDDAPGTSSMDSLRDMRRAVETRIRTYEQKILRDARLRRMLDALSTGGLRIPAQAFSLIPKFEMPVNHRARPMPMPASRISAPGSGVQDFALKSYLAEVDRAFALVSPARLTQSTQALATIDHALTRWGAQQAVALDTIDAALSDEIARLASVPRALGVEPRITGLAAASQTGVGGPYVPVDPSEQDQDPFGLRIERIELAVAQITQLGALVQHLPIRHPIDASTPISSRFGARRDPFTGRKAMHQGIDFRAGRGTPVLATGAGTIRKARRQGGYGRMVVIDHGNGLTTRFGHLHRISVSEGDDVQPGDKIGTVGSTGRSTGPHLHYEVRRDGKARNPISFLSVGATL